MGKNKTIYFRTGIYEKLPPDAGPLINDLLEAHFNRQENAPKLTPKPAVSPKIMEDLKKDPVFASAVDASYEKPCCANKANRCQHWDWDGDRVEWVNSISGRRVAA